MNSVPYRLPWVYPLLLWRGIAVAKPYHVAFTPAWPSGLAVKSLSAFTLSGFSEDRKISRLVPRGFALRMRFAAAKYTLMFGSF